MNTILSRLPKIRPRMLPALIAGCGIAGLIFRLLYTAIGTDGKGLLIPGHPAWICVCLTVIAAAGILVLGVLPIRGSADYSYAFPGSIFRTAGNVPAAVSVFTAAMAGFQTGPVQGILLLLTAAAFLLVAFCRLTGKTPPFLFHAAICVYFAAQMLTLYRTWSFDPQLSDYCFQLFACIALTLTAYQLAAFDIGKGSHRKLWAAGLAAVYLCCLSADAGLFFITGGIWAFASLSNLRRPRQRKVLEAEEPINLE